MKQTYFILCSMGKSSIPRMARELLWAFSTLFKQIQNDVFYVFSQTLFKQATSLLSFTVLPLVGLIFSLYLLLQWRDPSHCKRTVFQITECLGLEGTRAYLVSQPGSSRVTPRHIAQDCIQMAFELSPVREIPQLLCAIYSRAQSPTQ